MKLVLDPKNIEQMMSIKTHAQASKVTTSSITSESHPNVITRTYATIYKILIYGIACDWEKGSGYNFTQRYLHYSTEGLMSEH